MPSRADTDPAAALLALLDAAGDAYRSGAELGASLGVSRAAVWKRIEALRAAGYEIEARPRAGYRLREQPDVLTPARVQAELGTRRIGRHYHHVLETSSTMTLAADLARDGAADGTVVVAERQTAGRGRMGRAWHSAPGRGIWMTVILRPRLSPMELGPLTLLAAVAVAEGIRTATGLTPGIKWPNDLLLDDRKVCGILTELVAEQDAVDYVLLGIGLNVHQAVREFPRAVRESATSLALAGGRPVERVGVCRAVCAALDAEYDTMLRDGFASVLGRWNEQTVTLGARVRVAGPMGEFTGVAENLTPHGGLIVRRDDGSTTTVLSGDVTLTGGRT